MICILQIVIGRPSDPLFIQQIKDAITREIAENPGTPIMPISDLKENSCEARPFNHTIESDNCKPKTIQNRFCYGQCNSFYIPGKKVISTCQQCKPELYVMDTVTLECTKDNHLRFKDVQVQMVISCKCEACS